ncbi:hypothetical protein M2145_001352 [Lachnospiraceae bacterium PF1-21]|uniref:Uncharacterized protein n=1 Tax=Hespellia stercorisuis DSM 15480 TaxID=1121950 RepID=A0A1M6T5J1_9FIRM|nr:hypothetical protein [Hespellia stercorisuis]SHK52223.1 hypothetical protein SAMN02745243_03136 [Hespellia stercorisuis DSM 15480]
MKIKKLSKVFTLTIALCLMAVSLTACGGSKGDVKTAKEPVLASEAFNQEGIWFTSEGIVGKDENIYSILVFDGKGNVTPYKCDKLTFSDLKELSDDEIISLAKEQDKTRFESDIASLTSSIDNEKTKLSEERDSLENDMNEAIALEPDMSSEYKELYDVDRYQEEFTFMDSLLSEISNLEYKEPESVPYLMHIETDNSGNGTKEETLEFEREYLSTSYSNNMTEIKKTSTAETQLFPDYGTQTVYDMNFRGFGSIVTIVSENHAGFMLDTPDTKGIEVD